MISISLPSGIQLSGIVTIVVTFLLGLLIGVLVKELIKVGIVLLIIVVLLYALGYIHPSFIQYALHQAGVVAQQAYSYAQEYKNIIPYTSIAFIIGFVIGLWKG
ncbi:hypothetical protein HS7_10290 [Sulfolobales archaeon HS-7]|nr:hypothetical protein HS7_10290 [Sulfolobales archaeon HS-7]